MSRVLEDNAAEEFRALVVDDEPLVAKSLAELLLSLGVTSARVASTGSEALEKIANEDFDVVFCDLHMPGMDGVETMRQLAGQRRDTAIVVLSGRDEKVLRTVGELGRRRGLNVVATLAKPITLKQLTQALSTVRTGISERPPRPLSDLSEQALWLALETSELRVHYQPQLRLADGEPHGLEALVRWEHPDHGLVLPDRFVPLAEATGLIEPLTDFVAAQAVTDCGKFHAQGMPISVSVNLSAKTLRRLDLPDRLEQEVARAQLAPEHVTLEMTESGVTADIESLLDISARLRLKGFRLSIDDFGTGSSSMTQLQRLPFTDLKIDRAFVRDACTDSESHALVTSSVELARTLQLKVVAEGIETADTWSLLASLGVDIGQGNHMAPAMPIEAVLPWLSRWRSRVA
ncbi:MAG: EAL domain-containing response regulator [Myxococcales bacterium]|nr:EAL domain-containing response regulator [Myxococcales bacterium]